MVRKGETGVLISFLLSMTSRVIVFITFKESLHPVQFQYIALLRRLRHMLIFVMDLECQAFDIEARRDFLTFSTKNSFIVSLFFCCSRCNFLAVESKELQVQDRFAMLLSI